VATPLRAVKAGEKAPAKDRKLTVTQAASTGTARELLVAMRDRVATDVENPNTPARDLAALTRRLMDITKEIEAIDAREGEDDGPAQTPDDDWDAV
jgi:hypothetical protein